MGVSTGLAGTNCSRGLAGEDMIRNQSARFVFDL